MKLGGLGIDMLEIRRFKTLGKNNRFLKNNFSKQELDYCFSFTDYATRLAGTFCAKEAVFKSLDKNMLFSQIEVRRESNGKPTIWIGGRKEKSINVSISHTKTLAFAIAIKNEH